jgi:hypothetical protein
MNIQARKKEIAKVKAMSRNELLLYSITSADNMLSQFAVVRVMEMTADAHNLPKHAEQFKLRREQMEATNCLQSLERIMMTNPGTGIIGRGN